MESKSTLKRARAPGIEKLVLMKQGRLIYKFSKKSGKNCGPLQKNEERDRTTYEYSDEM